MLAMPRAARVEIGLPAAPPPPGPPPGPNYEWKKLPGVGGSYDGYGWVERGRAQGD